MDTWNTTLPAGTDRAWREAHAAGTSHAWDTLADTLVEQAREASSAAQRDDISMLALIACQHAADADPIVACLMSA